jgi:uncharacterized flavoprotein (TIGR03862 family)
MTPSQIPIVSKTGPKIAILGAGPAGLMAAHTLASAGAGVVIYEKRSSPGRKLLIAGSSGLNIGYDCPPDELLNYFSGDPEFHRRALEFFPLLSWRGFIEDLGIPTFLGTSRRWFVDGMKASRLLKLWMNKLEDLGVEFRPGIECIGFESHSKQVNLTLNQDGRVSSETFNSVCFALGGGSWEPKEKPLRWPKMFKDQGVTFIPFQSSNVGFRVAWPPRFLEEAEGKPIKNVVLSSSRGSRAGDLVVTAYGLEGTPIYTVGNEEKVTLDLKPDWSIEQVTARLRAPQENLAPMRRVKKTLGLGPGALALVYHLGALEEIQKKPLDEGTAILARMIKEFPLELLERQPLDEAISSTGGVDIEELDDHQMLKKFPGVFLAGEMLNWDAPTGGFLIHGCVAQGAFAAVNILNRMK